MKHRLYSPKTFVGHVECSTCRRIWWENDTDAKTSECLAASHPDPEINRLYRARRKACEAADGSGFSAMKGWDDSERIARELRRLDPDGDWFYEGNRYDGLGWRVMRPEVEQEVSA